MQCNKHPNTPTGWIEKVPKMLTEFLDNQGARKKNGNDVELFVENVPNRFTIDLQLRELLGTTKFIVEITYNFQYKKEQKLLLQVLNMPTVKMTII